MSRHIKLFISLFLSLAIISCFVIAKYKVTEPTYSVTLVTKENCKICKRNKENIVSFKKETTNKKNVNFKEIKLKENEGISDVNKRIAKIINESDSKKSTPFIVVEKKGKVVYSNHVDGDESFHKPLEVIGGEMK